MVGVPEKGGQERTKVVKDGWKGALTRVLSTTRTYSGTCIYRPSLPAPPHLGCSEAGPQPKSHFHGYHPRVVTRYVAAH